MYGLRKILTLLLVTFVSLTFGQTIPKLCNETSSITFDPSQLSGNWYEVARSPALTTSFLCAQVTLKIGTNNLLDISTTYSVTPLYPYVNQTMTASVSLGEANNPDGYNFSYVLGPTTYPLQTYKLLDTDYKNYAFVCGYPSSSNNATFFSIILTRERMLNSTALNRYESMAAGLNFSGFSNSSMTTITQDTCLDSGVSRSIPNISYIFGLIAILWVMLF